MQQHQLPHAVSPTPKSILPHLHSSPAKPLLPPPNSTPTSAPAPPSPPSVSALLRRVKANYDRLIAKHERHSASRLGRTPRHQPALRLSLLHRIASPRPSNRDRSHPNHNPSSSAAQSSASLSAQVLPVLSHPKSLDGTRVNGRVEATSPRRKRPRSQSLDQQLADAALTIPKKHLSDPRFVSCTRPIDALTNLRPTLSIALFPDGYVSRDPALDSSSSRSHELDPATTHLKTPVSPKLTHPKPIPLNQLPRFPYDRHSRTFLQSLDLGLIPPDEDLPHPQNRHYYDGCLVVDVLDLRNVSNIPASLSPHSHLRYRLLLRPHMSTIFRDIDELVATLKPHVAREVEERIINLTAPPLLLNPAVRISPYSLSDTAHTNIHPLNIIRAPKRRKLNRPPGPPRLRSTSTAAMLLISAAEKQMAAARYAALSMRTTSDLTTPTVATSAAHTPSSSAPTEFHPTIAQSDTASSASERSKKASSFASTKLHIPPNQPKLYLRPSLQLIHTARTLAGGKPRPSHSPQPRQHHNSYPLTQTERLRTIHLILLDQEQAHEMQQITMKAQAAAASGSNVAERARNARSQVLAKVNKPGRPLIVVELSRQVDRQLQVSFTRGTSGEKDREIIRMTVGSVEEGNTLLDEFKEIARKDRYLCYQDASARQIMAIQQRQRQLAEATASQQSRVAQRELAARTQAVNAAKQATRTAKIPPVNANIQRIQAVHAKHKQFQAHRQQQQLQRQHAERQKQQQLQQQQQQMQRQQQQMIRQQLQHRQQHLQQLQSNPTIHPTREEIQQQLSKNGLTSHPGAVHLVGGARGGTFPKGVGVSGGHLVQPGTVSAGVHTAALGNFPNAGAMRQNQLFPQHLQQLQQIQSQHHLRAEQQRNMLAAVTGHGGGTFGANANFGGSSLTAHQVQSRALAAAMGNGGVVRGSAKVPVSATVAGLDGLNHARLPPQFSHQRENVEASARGGKQ